jgi:S1-C subfamily serine protease
VPWLIGGIVAGLFLLVTLIIVLVVVTRDSPSNVASASTDLPSPPPPGPQRRDEPFKAQPPDNGPVEGQPVADPGPVAPQPEVKAPPPVEEEPPRPAPAGGGLGGEALGKVKRATVYLRVTTAEGKRGSGTGFFGAPGARNIILTNAHVVGMLAPESPRPKTVEVFVNSGQEDEWRTTARVLGVDRDSDLAVLDIGRPDHPTPEPLVVKSASGLHETSKLFVAGFPFGEKLGKEITISETTVSSMRKKDGVLHRIQVNGGMNPGNSGGPVVDSQGHVVGVAVSGIPGTQINNAIPGERVHTILSGRISSLTFHQPFIDGDRVGALVVMQMIDPRGQIREVAVELWTGDKPADERSATRPASRPPPRLPGDSQRQLYPLGYDRQTGEGRQEIFLPPLPSGKVYWQQPKWKDDSGKTHWASAAVLNLPQAVERKPARLVLRYSPGATRNLKLSVESALKVSAGDDDSETYRMVTEATFREQVASASPAGSVLRLQYRTSHRTIFEPGQPGKPSNVWMQVRDSLPAMLATLQFDRQGNLTGQNLVPVQPAAAPLGEIQKFHTPIQHSLEAMAVSLPPGGTVKPGQSWKGTPHHLPIDKPGKVETGWLDMTYTYLGVRKRDGREEAVLHINGEVRADRDAGDAISGRATGVVLIDLASGQTILAKTTVTLQLQAVLKDAPTTPVKLLSTLNVRLERKL